MTPRERLIDLSNQRNTQLTAASAAMAANDTAAYDAAMEQVTNLNTEIERVQNLITEQERQIDMRTPSAGEQRDMAEERAETLRNGGAITFSNDEARRMLRNAVTLADTFIAEPTGVDGRIHDAIGNVPSSIIDHVSVMDLTGMGSFLVPYAISDLTATAGKVTTRAGQLRAGGSEPTMAYSEVRPYEVNVTQYVDRNLSRLSPVQYYGYIQGMAMRAVRRKVAELICNGDGQGTPDMFGILTAKNKAGGAICASVSELALDENIIDNLFYAYGSDEAVGENAYLYLTKADLKTIGMLRNVNKEKIFKLSHSSANEGVIDDSGSATPYGILKNLDGKVIYGDPANYLLGLFGGMTVRIDESYKAGERLHTILCDAMVGGNVIVDKGFVVGTKAAG